MREMRDSGVEWIGKIPAYYEILPIGSLFSIKKDIIGHEPEMVLSITQTGIRPKDLTSNEGQNASSYAHYQIVNTGDYAMNHMDLLTGWIDISKYDGVTSPDYRVFTINDKTMSADYFLRVFQYYYANRVFFGFGQGVATLGRWRLPAANFKKIDVPVPPIDEQHRIVHAIDDSINKVDALIANVQSQIEKLKAYKQSVITEVVTKGLDPDVPMKDSGVEWIGEIPETWGVAKLQYCAEIRSGITLGKNHPAVAQLFERPYLRVANVQSGGVELENLKTINVTADEDTQYRLSAGEVLMTEGGDRDKLGRGCVWQGQVDPCLHQNHIFALRTNELLNPYFLSYVTASSVGRVYFDITAIKTTNLACTNSSKVLAFRLPLPSISEQEELVRYLDERCSKIDQLIAIKQKKIDKLNEYKKSIIYEYVTGKREVRS